MLHPKQFEVNETWIAFRLNNAPIQTELDGDFNCIALMDAASCFILSSKIIPAAAAEPTRAQFRRLLKDAKRHKQQLPRTLFVPREYVADRVTLEATQQGIEVVRVPESELLIFIGEAREGFGEVSLERRKIYVALPDTKAERTGYLRIIDESGEDYLYPAQRFVAAELPVSTRRVAQPHR